MELKDLHKDGRYLFKLNINNRQFRATFIDIIGNTVRVKQYEKNNVLDTCLLRTFPLEWLKKVENLSIITRKKILNDDMLNVIDLFL